MGQHFKNWKESITFVGTIQQNKVLKSLIILMIILFIGPVVASAVTPDIYVNTTGWWRAGGAFNTSSTQIQAAITTAAAGDTIYVYNGSYSANVNVNKRVTLQGEGAGVVNVTAALSSDHVFEVTVDYVNISGFKVTGATDNSMAGIYLLSNVGHGNISDNNASNNYFGIYLSSSSNNTLTNNTANSNTIDGIYLLSSSNNNTLTSNTANSNVRGIHLYDSSSSNTLANNTANSNTQSGIQLESSSNNNTLTNNTANSNINYDGIFLYSSSNNTLTSNTANSNQQRGIYLTSSSNNNTLTNNTASNNYNGILLDSSSNNTLMNNTLSENIYNFYITGTTLSHYTHDINTSNKVEDKPIYYIKDAADTVYNSSTNAGTFYCINCVNVTIENLDLKNNGNGILFWNSTRSNIQNVSASNNYAGIYLYSSSNNNTITNNNANSNNYDGIYLSSSNNNTLTNNNANSNYGYGIYLQSSSNNTITNNTANSNSNFGIYLTDSSSNNMLTSNNANSNTQYGIYLQYSSNNTLTSNNANSNPDGGIYLQYSSNNTLTSNNANSNTWYGIYLQYSSNNTLTSNNANSNTDNGIYLDSSSNNTIYNNYFNNTNNAFDNGYNVWNTTITSGTNIISGSWLGGNYWSNYAGEDTDGDRLGDTLTPYNNSGIITYGGDYHPLMNADTTAPSITIISPENTTYITSSIPLNVTTNQTANVTYSLNGNINLSLYNLTTGGNATITGLEGANNITVYANDSVGNLNSSIVYFTVSTAPVVTASKTYSNYTQIIQMTIDPNITVTDGETNVTGATVSIGVGYISSEDYLNYT